MWLFDYIYPKKCVGCGAKGKYICQECEKSIGALGESLRYEGVVRKIIKEIKYRGSYDMVSALVDVWISHKHVNYQRYTIGYVVAAVPMYGPKQKQRGFNQAEMIARELAKRWGLPYQELLVRTRETKPMYGLKIAERASNVGGAFCCNQKYCPERVILVDDVWTTGATMRECSKQLLTHGATDVTKIAIAR